MVPRHLSVSANEASHRTCTHRKKPVPYPTDSVILQANVFGDFSGISNVMLFLLIMNMLAALIVRLSCEPPEALPGILKLSLRPFNCSGEISMMIQH